jgi:transposase
MLQITPHMRVLVAIAPVDFRNGIDGLVRVCQATLQEDAMTGTLFVFRNRHGTSLKAIVYDGQGFWLCQKRLSTGRFTWWPSGGNAGDARSQSLAAHQLQVLLSAGNAARTGAPEDWRPIGPRR